MGVPTVLIVDDEPDVRTLLRITLHAGADGWQVVGEAGGGLEALEMWRDFDELPDVVILDNRMPDLSGLEVAVEMLAEEPGQLIVMCTSVPDGATRRAAAEVGIAACLPKRDLDLLPAAIETLIDERHRPRQLRIVTPTQDGVGRGAKTTPAPGEEGGRSSCED